jgi:hypothetical protein
MPISYLKKDIIKIVTVISAVAFMFSIMIQFDCSKILVPCAKEYLTSLFIGVFASGIVVVAVTVMDYRNSVNHSRRNIIQLLLDIRSSIQYATEMAIYTEMGKNTSATPFIQQEQYRMTEEYEKIKSCLNTIRSILFTDQECICKESSDRIRQLSEEVAGHIAYLKIPLLFPSDIEQLATMIDGQKENLIRNGFTDKVEALILDILSVYYPRDYETIRKEFRESYENFFLRRFHWTD